MSKRVTCPRCGRRRTMQTAITWRPRPEGEFAPVCSGCWSELQIANALYAHAVATPGVVLSIKRDGE